MSRKTDISRPDPILIHFMKGKFIFITLAVLILVPLISAYSSDKKILWIKPIWTSRYSTCAVTITNDNRYIVTSSGSNLLFWDLLEGKIFKRLKDDGKNIYQLTVSEDNKYAFTGDESGVLKIWDIIAGKVIKTISAHDAQIFIINVSANGRYVLTGSLDGIKKLWDISYGKELWQHKGFKWNMPTIARLSIDGKQIIGEDDGSIVVWDAITGNIVRKIKIEDKKASLTLVSPDGRYAVIERFRSNESYPELWDIKEDKKIRIFNYKKYNENHISINSVWGAFTHDNKKLVSTYFDGKKYVLWNLEEDQPIVEFTDEHYEMISSTVFSRDGKYIVSIDGGIARLWNAIGGKEIAKFFAMKDGNWLVMTPEGYYSSSEKNTDEKVIVEYKYTPKCPLNNYRETFYRPDLVKVALSGGSLNEYKKIADMPMPTMCMEMGKEGQGNGGKTGDSAQ